VGTTAAVAVVVLLAVGVFGYGYTANRAKQEHQAALAKFTPSAENKDPSLQIAGIVLQQYAGGQHVTPDKQVAYTPQPAVRRRARRLLGRDATASSTRPPCAARTSCTPGTRRGLDRLQPDQVSGDALSTSGRRRSTASATW
jgi:hypothetical protein